MNLKLDENLPRILCAALSDFGHDVHSVFEENLMGRPDEDVWNAAQREGQVLDHPRSRLFGHSEVHPGIPSRHFTHSIEQSQPGESDLSVRASFQV
jgi:hypothetical protein